MKRPSIVYLGTALLVFVTVKLAWLAVQIPETGKHLIKNWQVGAFSAVITGLFFWKPRELRGIVAPYFIVFGLRGFAPPPSSTPVMHVIANGALALTFLCVGVMLFMLNMPP